MVSPKWVIWVNVKECGGSFGLCSQSSKFPSSPLPPNTAARLYF